MSWNIVQDWFLGLQNRYRAKFGNANMYNYPQTSSCVEHWANVLAANEDLDRINQLRIREHNNFILFRYKSSNPALWDKYDGFYRECRSLVLNKKTGEIVLAPYRKFFNLNEMEETSEAEIRKRLDKAKTVEITRKLDGSLISARYYQNSIVLATSTMLDSGNRSAIQLAKAYKYVNSLLNYQSLIKDNPDFTFMFELIDPCDMHVVCHNDLTPGLYLHGMRNVNTGEQLSYRDVLDYATSYFVKHTNTFKMTFDDVLEQKEIGANKTEEGFVLNVDGYYVKIKYNEFVEMQRHSHMLERISGQNVLEMIADETFDDWFASINDEEKRSQVLEYAEVVRDYERLMTDRIEWAMQDLYNELNRGNNKQEMSDMKAFAVLAQKKYPDLFNHLIAKQKQYSEYSLLKTKNGKYQQFDHIAAFVENNI